MTRGSISPVTRLVAEVWDDERAERHYRACAGRFVRCGRRVHCRGAGVTGGLVEWAARHGISPHALADLYALFEPPRQRGADGTEAGLQSRLRVEAPKRGGSLWRNNNGACMDETGRLIRYGLGNDSKKLNEVWKSSDLIGITPVKICQQHVGHTLGVFTACEVKDPNWSGVRNDREVAQAAFHTTVTQKGGIAFFATSLGDYHRATDL